MQKLQAERTYRGSLEAILFIFCKLGQHALQAIRVNGNPVGDGATQLRQVLLVCLQQDVQPTGPAIDF